MIYVILYLIAIVLANLSVGYFGISAVYVNAFLFIGLDLTARDKLHEVWYQKGLVWKMFLLITTGSLLSYLLNKDVLQIAIASMVAFGCAGIVDSIIYHFLHDKEKIIKINGSNVVSALVDSIVFPTIAFGGILPLVTLGQFVAKVLGGFVWSLVLSKFDKKV